MGLQDLIERQSGSKGSHLAGFELPKITVKVVVVPVFDHKFVLVFVFFASPAGIDVVVTSESDWALPANGTEE